MNQESLVHLKCIRFSRNQRPDIEKPVHVVKVEGKDIHFIYDFPQIIQSGMGEIAPSLKAILTKTMQWQKSKIPLLLLAGRDRQKHKRVQRQNLDIFLSEIRKLDRDCDGGPTLEIIDYDGK